MQALKIFNILLNGTLYMNNFIQSLNHSLATENWYAAITLALTLPDICASIDRPGQKISRERYAEWFDKYVGDRYIMNVNDRKHIFMNGDDLYSLRCAVLHQGISKIDTPKENNRVKGKFIFHHSKVVTMHKLCHPESRSILIEIKIFCEDIIFGVSKWNSEVIADKDDRRKNLISGLMTLHLPDQYHGNIIFAQINNPFA